LLLCFMLSIYFGAKSESSRRPAARRIVLTVVMEIIRVTKQSAAVATEKLENCDVEN